MTFINMIKIGWILTYMALFFACFFFSMIHWTLGYSHPWSNALFFEALRIGAAISAAMLILHSFSFSDVFMRIMLGVEEPIDEDKKYYHKPLKNVMQRYYNKHGEARLKEPKILIRVTPRWSSSSYSAQVNHINRTSRTNFVP